MAPVDPAVEAGLEPVVLVRADPVVLVDPVAAILASVALTQEAPIPEPTPRHPRPGVPKDAVMTVVPMTVGETTALPLNVADRKAWEHGATWAPTKLNNYEISLRSSVRASVADQVLPLPAAGPATIVAATIVEVATIAPRVAGQVVQAALAA